MSLQQKELTIRIKIEDFYRKLHTGELDGLYKLLGSLKELVRQAEQTVNQ